MASELQERWPDRLQLIAAMDAFDVEILGSLAFVHHHVHNVEIRKKT